MKTSNYVRGRAFEYRTRDKLKKWGAAYVMRAAQSKGIIDLLALWPLPYRNGAYLVFHKAPWLVQCKYGTGRLSVTEVIELKELALLTGAIPILARSGKNNRGVEFVDLATNQTITGGYFEERKASASSPVQGDSAPKAE